MCKEVLDVILNPEKALKEAKEKENYTRLMFVILSSVIISFLAYVIFAYPFGEKTSIFGILSVFLVLLVVSFVGVFFWGFLLKNLIGILEKKQSLYRGIVAYAYPNFYLSIFIFAILILAKIIGIFIGKANLYYALMKPDTLLSTIVFLALILIVAIYAVVTWIGYLLRALKEMFEVDYVTTIAASICIAAGYFILTFVIWYLLLSLTLTHLMPYYSLYTIH